MIKLAINGFGRIGRAVLKIATQRKEIEITAINDLGDIDNLAYLLQYDTVSGKSDLDITTEKSTTSGADYLLINGKKILFTHQKDPTLLPWKQLDVDVVVESTGFFTEYEKASLHLEAGAKKVVISAPAKGDTTLGKTVLMGINENELKVCTVTSNGSCTTNATSPIAQIMSETLGIKKALLNTIHGYTATQKVVDSPDNKDWRKGRAAAQNIIPSTTGAAISVTEALPRLKGLFDGIALRVPVLVGSIIDFTFVAGKKTSVEEINTILRNAAKEKRWENIFTATDEKLVSSDIIGSPYASIADLSFTKVVGEDLVKILAWYDNEIGYSHALVEHIIKSGNVQ